MDLRFLPHNLHLESPASFFKNDPHLKALQGQPLVHRSALLDRLPRHPAGIYTIGGGRQVGKTTLMKQWMADLLRHGVASRQIVYFTGELIDDHHSLVRLVSETLKEMPGADLGYLLLDEITYIRQWDKGIKYLADAGMLANLVVVLSGSDQVIIKEARMRFPGRRGAASRVDFLLYPLSFFETVKLKKVFPPATLDRLMHAGDAPSEDAIKKLFAAFGFYLLHGGFLTAINDMARQGRILPATFATYSDWIRGDVLKRGKHEHYLREVLAAIIRRHGSQVTWNALARDLTIDHPSTIADYAALLESMGAVIIQAAIVEHKLCAAPKKARKLMFSDPFIVHAVRAWLNPAEDPFSRQAQPLVADPDWSGRLVEACAVAHYRRHFPTYYIKAQGEVDIAYVDKNRFWPLEIKWSRQLRPKDLKQIAKYPNGRILGRRQQPAKIMGRPAEPLPLVLLRLG